MNSNSNNVASYDPSVTVRNYLKSMGVARLMAQNGTTEVAINRPGEIWTETREGWQQHIAPMLTLDVCQKLANALSVFNKVTPPLSANSPIKPVRLPDGERGQVMLAPACEPSTVSMTIRIPSSTRLTLDDYERFDTFKGFRDVSPSHLASIASSSDSRSLDVNRSFHDTSYRGAVPPDVYLDAFEYDMLEAKAKGDVARLFQLAVKNKLNIVTVGGTGSGKTTLMKMLADLVPADTRMGTIEDTHELSLPKHPNRVHMFFSETLSAKEIVKSTLRMKLDRVFLAELRGDETWDYLSLLNTGCQGGMTSVHANDPPSTFSRIATLIKSSPVGQTLDWHYILREVKTTIDLIIFMDKKRLTQLHYDPVEKYRLIRGQV